jgi:2-succinyl-5-enolpyruvyl-6-hydroxy-3-cyclohexene-1-carboxylate synthase
LALRLEPRLRCWVHLDERAGAFFALGAAKASGRPVVVLVTSGTAAVELAPAIAEARYGRVPLIALTADRPPELRDRGAPQAIDQDHLYGRFAKWYAELPVPEPGDLAEANVRGTVARAVATSQAAPAGPVHVNLPYREPLVPVGDLIGLVEGEASASRDGAGYGVTVAGQRVLPAAELARLAEQVAGARRGVIVCGPLDAPGFGEAVARLASTTGFPIIADALANVRFGPHDRSHVIARADALLRVASFAEAQQPDLVLRFGGTPTSKAILGWLVAGAAAQVVVDDGGWDEPTLLPVTVVQAEPVELARSLAARLGGAEAGAQPAPTAGWLASWCAAEDAAADATAGWLGSLDEPFEGEVFAGLSSALAAGASPPDGVILFAGNSMPVRDMEAFLGSGPAAIRCLGNRGANGIDGLVSTALGMAAVSRAPVVAVVGDVSFLHDLNALLAAARLGVSATIVLVDNDGGGIFSFLPQADADEPGVGLPTHFEELFGTPHGTEFGPLVRALGAGHEVVASHAVAGAVVALLNRPGVQVLEVRTERRRNVELHRSLQAAVAAAVSQLLADSPADRAARDGRRP